MFITLEGPDGSGKSSQIGPLVEHLRQQGHPVIATREPGGTPIGDEIRRTVLGLRHAGMAQRTEVLLFLAARAQHVDELIIPHLAQGDVVVSDRYADSTLAYQGYGLGTDLETLRMLLDFATGGVQPDLTLLLDLEVDEGLRRRRTSGGEWNRLDAQTLDYHTRVRNGYLELVQQEPQRWVIIDANRPPEEVQASLQAVVLERLEKYYPQGEKKNR